MAPLDFHGIISLDQSVYSHLVVYLNSKESQVATDVINSFQPPFDETTAPTLPPGLISSLRLSDAIEVLEKKVRQASLNRQYVYSLNDWKEGKEKVRQAFWNYVEVLEGSVTEFFQKLDQLGFEKWKNELFQVVESIKVILMQHLENAIWSLKRLESVFKKYRDICTPKLSNWALLKEKISFSSSLIDNSLTSHLEKTQKYLSFGYLKFQASYHKYQDLEKKCSEGLEKFNSYLILYTLEPVAKNQFKKIYELLKLRELNTYSRSLPQMEIIRSIKNVASPEKIQRLFHDYYRALRSELFAKSRALKNLSEDPSKDHVKQHEDIDHCRTEVHTLSWVVKNYQDYLLRTDPNPYVRSRWGFPEWVAGPEPLVSKHLVELNYKIEELDHLFLQLQVSIEQERSLFEGVKLGYHNEEIQTLLHEMGQPLTSLGMMKAYANRILNHLQELDELGSHNPQVVDFFDEVLAKAMRADWKYHAMFEIPLFHQIFSIHQGICGSVEDRQHQMRFQSFKTLVRQMEEWAKKKSLNSHVYEIEQDANDIKEKLQEFFAHVQRVLKQNEGDKVKSKEVLKGISHELLEYRYLFGKFFHALRLSDPQERLLRNQFLFVDQYFESIENKIYDFKLHY